MPVPAGGGSSLDLFASLDDLADALHVAVGDLDTDAATLALEVATGAIQAAVGQRILQVSNDTVVIDLDCDYRSLYLSLPEQPVTAVASAMIGVTPVTGFSTQLSRARIWRAYGWRSATLLPFWNAPSTVTVVYTHGYDLGDQRMQLARGVALDLAKARYSSTAAGAVTREQIDDYSVQYASAVGHLESMGGVTDLLRRRYGRRGASSVRLAMATC